MSLPWAPQDTDRFVLAKQLSSDYVPEYLCGFVQLVVSEGGEVICPDVPIFDADIRRAIFFPSREAALAFSNEHALEEPGEPESSVYRISASDMQSLRAKK